RSADPCVWLAPAAGSAWSGLERVGAGDAGVPAGALFEDASLGEVVDIDQAEALRVAVCPLEVVHQRPDEVAAQIDACLYRGMGGSEVCIQERDPLRVVDLA